jgi:hypothetical protein
VLHVADEPRPGIDRMASAWLIRAFVDPRAAFAFGERPSSQQTALQPGIDLIQALYGSMLAGGGASHFFEASSASFCRAPRSIPPSE